MAKIFLVRIGNLLDDTNYSRVVITENSYTSKEVKMSIGSEILTDLGEDFVVDIVEAKAEYIAYSEDDFRCIEPTLRDLRIIK